MIILAADSVGNYVCNALPIGSNSDLDSMGQSCSCQVSVASEVRFGAILWPNRSLECPACHAVAYSCCSCSCYVHDKQKHCSSFVPVQTPKQADETCKTPREAKTAAAVPTVVHVEATAADPAKKEPAPTAVPATAPQHHAPQAPEPKPFVDAASLHKPLKEINLLQEQPPAAPEHPDSSHEHAHAGHAQHTLTGIAPAHSTHAEAEQHAGLQDSYQHAQHAAPAATAAAVDHSLAVQELSTTGGITMQGEGTPVEPRSRLTTVDGVTTHQSTCSNYSGERHCMQQCCACAGHSGVCMCWHR
jgi:hypothetical protein